MSWLAPTGKAASNGLQTSAIGSPGGLGAGDLASALQANPLLASLKPSDVTGASAPIPQSNSNSMFSGMGGGGSGGAASRPGEQAINLGLQGASLIPGPQQPFVAAASSIAPMVEGLFGGGGGSAPQIQFPTLQHSQGQILPPITSTSVGNAGPLSSSGLNPQLMRLIQMLQGGGSGGMA